MSISHNITTGMIVLGITIGAMVAFSVYFFQTRILGSLVRALLQNARGEQNAKTLEEIEKNNFFFKHFLKDGSILRKYVRVVGDTVPKNADDEYDFTFAKFYIDEDKADVAEIRYSKETKIHMYVIGMLACALIGVAMYFVFPYMLNLI